MINSDNHFCRAADSCVSRTADGPAITSKPRTICFGCTRRLQTQLEELPHLKLALQSFKAASLTGEHGSKVNATPTPSTPLNLRVVDLVDEIDAVISRAGGPTIRISDLVNRPAEEFTVWRGGRLGGQLLDGVDRALAIGVVWRKADSVVGLSRQWVKRQAPCPRCNETKLGMWSGEDSVHCMSPACGETYTLGQYEDFCLIKAGMERNKK